MTSAESRADGSTAKRPYLVLCTTMSTGHFSPTFQIADYMIQRGFEATIITDASHRQHVEAVGARYVELPVFMPSPEAMEERKALKTGFEAMIWGLTEVVVKRMPLHYGTLRDTLAALRREVPGREVVVIHDVVFLGANPLASGAPLPEGFTKRPPIINLNLVPLQIPSVDVGPFGLALPPDSSESGRARNKALTHVYNLPQGPFGPFTRDFRAMMESLGAVAPADDAFTAITMNPDVMLQACSPSLEYPRSDLPANIKFIGCLPCKTPAPTWQYPEWWSEVVGAAGPQRKRIVGVAQGTVALDYNKLAVPAMQGLAGRDDVLVVVVLGVKGATLPEGTVVPANARVVDVLPYEALLPHLDVWVINSGYGGFTQGVMHGVPMLLAGDTEDKAEVSMRGEWAGVGYNLRTGSPTPEQVAEGVSHVLANPGYKKRVMEIREENMAMKSLETVERYVWELAGGISI